MVSSLHAANLAQQVARLGVSDRRQAVVAHAHAAGATASVCSPVEALFTPIKVGDATLKHRVVLPPLTRCRAIGAVPRKDMATYYEQRTTDGGLLIAEATCICPEAQGYPNVPGIWTEEQVAGWKPVVEAVHRKGGVFYCQLWHVGRASHPDFQPGNVAPVAPSAIRICDEWEAYTPQSGMVKYPTPRALEVSELPAIIDAYVASAKNAIAAGFDGVEIHAANGYLLSQFMATGTNTRTDQYGGSVENRVRLTLQVIDAVVETVGASRVAVRLSPYNAFLDCVDGDPLETYTYVLGKLKGRGLAYISMVEPRVKYGNREVEGELTESLRPFRDAYDGVVLVAGGHDGESGGRAVLEGDADLVGYGRIFISNPDLPLRLKLGAPLTPYDRDAFYSGTSPEGYTEYPSLTEDEIKQLSKAAE